MNNYTILKRAYDETLRLWAYEKEKAEDGSIIGKARVGRYWDELQELGKMLKEEENKLGL